MLSKQKSSLVSSLKYKKFRDSYNMFVAEGEKLIMDLAMSFRCKYLISTDESLLWSIDAEERIKVDSIGELKRISSLTTPSKLLAVFYKADYESVISVSQLRGELVLAIDSVQDTGNLGTIVRIADWYGIGHIVCSHGTVDVYNPKCVQATMGALANVSVYYTNLFQFLSEAQECNIPVYGTFLTGENIYRKSLSNSGIILLGNEGHGISDSIAGLVTDRITIPHFSASQHRSESLNVAIATAVVCSEFRRRDI